MRKKGKEKKRPKTGRKKDQRPKGGTELKRLTGRRKERKGKNRLDTGLKDEKLKFDMGPVYFSSIAQNFLFVTPWTATRQAALFITNSWNLLKLMSSSVIPFSSCLQSFPASASFPRSQFFASGGQSIGVLASSSVLPMNFQDWFPLGWTGLISLQSKGLSRVFSNTMVQKHQFFSTQLSL